jgi:hypothetical protein
VALSEGERKKERRNSAHDKAGKTKDSSMGAE